MSAGEVLVSLSSSPALFAHAYSRHYKVTISALVGLSPNRTCTATIESTSIALGNERSFDRTVAGGNALVVTGIAENNPLTHSIVVEHGIVLDMSFVVSTPLFSVFEFDAIASPLLELHSALGNVNQFASISAVTPDVDNTGTGVVAIAPQAEFTGLENFRVQLQVTAITGPVPKTATFTYRFAGPTAIAPGSTGAISAVTPTVTLPSGIKLVLTFGASNFVVGDLFEFECSAPRKDYNGKESREYEIAIAAAPSSSLTLTYSGNTALSGFGTSVLTEGLALNLPNGVSLYARNLTPNANQVADAWGLSVASDGTISWGLRTRRPETISVLELLTDNTGITTGQVGASYFRTRDIPLTVKYVRSASTSADLAWNQVPGTSVIWFATAPLTNIEIVYEAAGLEPAPGQSYFMTGYVKRPASDYTSPQLFTDVNSAADFVAPMTIDNDAAIANQIAWAQGGEQLPGIIFNLVRDEDEDGVMTTSDYRQALRTSELTRDLINLVVVNRYEVMADARDSCVQMNNPFVAKQRVLVGGFPTLTPIGSATTAGSQVDQARTLLQVYEESIARGTIAAVSHTWGKIKVKLEDGQETIVQVDGSFFAVAVAARSAALSRRTDTILNLTINGFYDIERLTDDELTTVQAAGLIGFNVTGLEGQINAIYDESHTTDSTEPSTSELSGTMQRQYVLARLKAAHARGLKGIVPLSALEGMNSLSGTVLLELAAMVVEGEIAPFSDDTGSPRQAEAGKDIQTMILPDLVNYAFACHWNQRYPFKSAYGVFAVDTNDLPRLA